MTHKITVLTRSAVLQQSSQRCGSTTLTSPPATWGQRADSRSASDSDRIRRRESEASPGATSPPQGEQHRREEEDPDVSRRARTCGYAAADAPSAGGYILPLTRGRNERAVVDELQLR